MSGQGDPVIAARDEIGAAVDAAIQVLQRHEVQLPRIDTIEVEGLPASVLAYRLYETEARTDTLIGLNPLQDPAMLRGEVQILRDG
jgi:prophage DNA circulation protein